MRNGTSVSTLARSGDYIVIQRNRFVGEGIRMEKRMNVVSSGDGKLEIPITEDSEVSGKRFFTFKAVICFLSPWTLLLFRFY